MITKASHFSIFVLDQASANDFYINKLGFKVKTDAQMGPKGRSLTVNPPEQLDLEYTLMAIDDKMMFSAESVATMRELVKADTFGFAVFESDDMLASYEELLIVAELSDKDPLTPAPLPQGGEGRGRLNIRPRPLGGEGGAQRRVRGFIRHCILQNSIKAKGVHFKKEAAREFWGLNAVLQDDSGDWFSLSEAKKV